MKKLKKQLKAIQDLIYMIWYTIERKSRNMFDKIKGK